MGDRTWIRITVRREDEDKVERELQWGGPNGEALDSSPVVVFSSDEVNYGGSDETDRLAAAGIPYWVEHGQGGGYQSGEGVCDGEIGLFVSTVQDRYFVETDAEGHIDSVSHKRLLEFLQLKRRTMALLGLRGPVEQLAAAVEMATLYGVSDVLKGENNE